MWLTRSWIGTAMIDISESQAWGLLNLGVAINCLVIGARLLARAARDPKNAGARIVYGTMFLTVSVFFGVLSVSQWAFDDGRPEAGLVGLGILWVATTIAVLYLLVWGRRTRKAGTT